MRIGTSQGLVEWILGEGILTGRGKYSSPKKVVPTGSQKTRYLPILFLHILEDLPQI